MPEQGAGGLYVSESKATAWQATDYFRFSIADLRLRKDSRVPIISGLWILCNVSHASRWLSSRSLFLAR